VSREASKTGANVMGYEFNPLLVVILRLLSHKYRKVRIIFADYRLLNFRKTTTVVYIYFVSRDKQRIIRKIQTETTTKGRPIYPISYGTRLVVMKPVKSVGVYHLYVFHPLQTDKAQV